MPPGGNLIRGCSVMLFPRRFWIETVDVMRLLGCHRSQVRRLQKKGEIPFALDAKGHAKFPRKHIEAMAIALGRVIGSVGLLHAKAFALFATGKSWQEAVVALDALGMAQPADVVRALHAEYLEKEKNPALWQRRRKKRARLEVDETGEEAAEDPSASADAWKREQAAINRSYQEAHEQRERDFVAQQAPKPNPADLPPTATKEPKDIEESAPLSDRILQILRILGRKPIS